MDNLFLNANSLHNKILGLAQTVNDNKRTWPTINPKLLSRTMNFESMVKSLNKLLVHIRGSGLNEENKTACTALFTKLDTIAQKVNE